MKLYNSKSTLECDAQLIFILVNPHYKLTESISTKKINKCESYFFNSLVISPAYE